MSRSAKLAWGLVVLVGILHYDFWYWEDTSLVFGFLPVGLAYHALISILAGVVWACVVRFAWPSRVEEWASGEAEAGDGGGDS